jgi:hypothetical protein
LGWIRGAAIGGSPRAIGALWPHQDGKGFNQRLECIPLNGAEIVIRQINADADDSAPPF